MKTDSGTTKGSGRKEGNGWFQGQPSTAALALLNPRLRLGAIDSYGVTGVFARCDE
jgi:hypothetical protein